MAELLSPSAIDSLLADVEASGMGLDGAQGLFSRMTKAVLERALQIEMADHLGYEKGDASGHGSGNSRNGSTGKSVITNSGPVQLSVPRDRVGTFEPKIVPKRTRRLGSVDDMILSLYARGMTTRDIKEHLAEVYGAEVSPGLVSNVTDVVQDEIVQWQTRPLDAVYPILYIDAVVVKIREGGTVDNRAAHLVIGVDMDGFKHVLGIWIAENEGAKFWQNVLNELVNRGLNDVMIVCCDGLTGLADAINNVWPKAIVQTCVVHLIRASMRFVAQNDRKSVMKSLRPIYEAVNEAAALQALNDL
ncbi:IS256 family transposase, partial [Actinokineospora sp.]|uniref:IS256 family transposase n=1 Tax=Actinokineospora sp. TaxID=1872133 RepID=UPI003D6A9FD4